MLLINLYAPPGVGKSTGMAYIFSKLKMLGLNCEMITEFAKDKVWEGNSKVFDNQAYIFGKQYFKTSRLEGEVDIAITDSPLPLSVIYNNNPILGDEFNKLVIRAAKSYDCVNVLLTRTKPYNPKGRFQTKEESDLIGVEIKKLLDENGFEYFETTGDTAGYDKIIDYVSLMIMGHKIETIKKILDEKNRL